MNEEAVAEMHTLVTRLANYIDGPEFTAKAVGFDSLAVAKRYQDLYALRLYDRLFPSGMNPRDIREAVATSKQIPGGLPELTLEQITGHAAVWKAMKDGNHEGLERNEIKVLALEFPGHSDLIVELMDARGMRTAGEIKEFLAQTGESVIPLCSGLL
jgi:hypothetical protein